MPAKSKAQERFLFANAKKFGGKKQVIEEWIDTAPKNLPERVSKPRGRKRGR